MSPFAPRRPQSRCGMKKNGYNWETASVFCPAAPESTVPDVLARELAVAGFTVLRNASDAGPNTIVLRGAVDQLFVEAKVNFCWVTFETDIGVSLTAETGTGLSASRHFYVKGEEASLFASDGDIQRSFESGVRQLAVAVAGAVANLAERWPPQPVDAPPEPLPPTEEPSVNPS